ALSRQRIFPYTDLLLHDLGPGLADGLREFEAGGADWRTPPLWGLAQFKTVSGADAGYLHDGRARDLPEAILWHGGEAQAARDRWAALPRDQRRKLIRFLASL
ncbi:MAG TPA: di-heme oxidoredictase family protein, partial [Fontimonas sp.]